jgi:hypothetical protein
MRYAIGHIRQEERKLNSQSSPHSINNYFTHEEKCSRFIVIHTEHALTDTSSRVKRKRREEIATIHQLRHARCWSYTSSQQLESEERGDRDPRTERRRERGGRLLAVG